MPYYPGRANKSSSSRFSAASPVPETSLWLASWCFLVWQWCLRRRVSRNSGSRSLLPPESSTSHQSPLPVRGRCRSIDDYSCVSQEANTRFGREALNYRHPSPISRETVLLSVIQPVTLSRISWTGVRNLLRSPCAVFDDDILESNSECQKVSLRLA